MAGERGRLDGRLYNDAMRVLVLSDVHGNLEALEAVWAAARGQYDRCVCLGDVVGYGADPNACAEQVRERAAVTVRGNHDRACVEPAQAVDFNPVAREAAEWTHRQLEEGTLAWLRALPAGPILDEGVQLAHGSPLDEDEYITSPERAARSLAAAPCALTVIGHTHLQGGFWRRGNDISRVVKQPGLVRVEADTFYLLNPGSVGQPRDGDWRAAYMIYDQQGGEASFFRVPYDLKRAQDKILDARLPRSLAERLAGGW